jgi:hypothetical protein
MTAGDGGEHPKMSRNLDIDRLRRWSLFAAGGAAFMALTAAGCGDDRSASETPAATTTVVSNSQPTGTTTTTTVTTAPSPAPTVPPITESVNAGPGGATGTQAELADEVNKRIIRNPQMTGSRVNVVVDDAGVATLTGFTQNQQQKALAAKAAENTTGVVSVVNKLEIRPTGGTGKAPKPAPTPAAPKTQIIVVPGPPAAAPSPAPSPAASPLEGYEENGTAPAPSPAAPAPTTPEGGQ